jgi:hypothetical protein
MDAVPTLLTAGYTKAVVVAVTGAGTVSSDGGSTRGTGVTEVAGTIVQVHQQSLSMLTVF